LTNVLESSHIRYLTMAAAALLERVGPYAASTASPSGEFEEVSNRSLPICVIGDCCADLLDSEIAHCGPSGAGG
jgi:hypothetical protein